MCVYRCGTNREEGQLINDIFSPWVSPQGWGGEGEQIFPHRRVSSQVLLHKKINLIGNGFDSTAGALLKAQLQKSASNTVGKKNFIYSYYKLQFKKIFPSELTNVWNLDFCMVTGTYSMDSGLCVSPVKDIVICKRE
jgi:hypothetical protein